MTFKAVGILGSGPAGMAAAWAAAMRGHPVVVISNTRQPSNISGAQYLHRAIPDQRGDLSPPDFRVQFKAMGTRDVYVQKIYGNNEPPFSSWDVLVTHDPVMAWSQEKVYERLFKVLASDGDAITLEDVTPDFVQELVNDDMFSKIVSTVPRPSLCRQNHTFASTTVRLMHGRYFPVDMNTVIYNGDPNYAWARASNINGNEWTEFGANPENIYAEEDALRISKKPTSHFCTCWADEPKLIFAGRFGLWAKGVLVDHAFYDTYEALG